MAASLDVADSLLTGGNCGKRPFAELAGQCPFAPTVAIEACHGDLACSRLLAKLTLRLPRKLASMLEALTLN